MKVVFTDAALDDLRSIAAYLAANHPNVALAVERRLHLVIARNGSLGVPAFGSPHSCAPGQRLGADNRSEFR
jgi:plasmid stabilization system protein ParE